MGLWFKVYMTTLINNTQFSNNQTLGKKSQHGHKNIVYAIVKSV